MRVLTLSALGLLLAAGLAAQDKWSLERCIQFALENNIQIQQARISEQASRYMHTQAVADFLPSVNADAGYGVHMGRSIDPTTYDFVNQTIQTHSVSLNSGVTLFNGLRKINILRSSKYDLLSSEYASKDVADNVALNVTRLYLQILLSHEELKKATERLAIAVQQLDQTRKLFDAGTITEGNVLDVKAQLAADSLGLVIARNALELSKLNLALLLEVENPDLFEVETPEIDIVPPQVLAEKDAEGIYLIAEQNQPALQSARYALQGSQYRWAAARGLYYPSLSFFYTLRTTYSSIGKRTVGYTTVTDTLTGTLNGVPFSLPLDLGISLPVMEDATFWQQYHDNFSQSLGLSLNIPLFNGLQVRTNVRNAKLNFIRAKYNLKNLQNQLRNEVHVAYTDAKAAYQKYLAAENSARALEKSFEYVTRKFNTGAATMLEYSTAGAALSAAQSEMLKAKYEYIFKLKVLDYYAGNPITLN
ncbi:MAG: transporter [Chitinophagales bacterium]|nr:MAG: transporter [Chitinophagales bacterium]